MKSVWPISTSKIIVVMYELVKVKCHMLMLLLNMKRVKLKDVLSISYATYQHIFNLLPEPSSKLLATKKKKNNYNNNFCTAG